MHRILTRAVLVLFSAWTLWAAEGSFALREGDTVVFYGDSITDQRLYTTFAETFVVTRFPQLHVRFVHSGWGGDRVTGGGGGPIDLRLRRDVFAYRPTVMTIMLGMNDGDYRSFDPAIFQTYSQGYESIIRNVKTAFPSVRITAIQPSPFDDVTREPEFDGGYNGVLVRYGAFIRELANREHLALADLNTPVVEMLRNAKSKNATVAAKILPDRVHPGPGGHLIMAEALLKSWNAPALVSDVTIEAGAGKVVRSENTEIAGVETTGGLRWRQTDRALPMPVDWEDEPLALAVHSSDFMDALNRETLKVTGLPSAQYTLTIDGAAVGDFSADALAKGINLAAYTTPMTQQAAAVHALTLKHNNIHYARWRIVQVPLHSLGADTAAAQSSLDSLEDQVVAAQRVAALPQPHRYELKEKP